MRLNARVPALLLLCTLCAPVLTASADAGAVGAPLTVEDLVRMKRVSDPQVSPDGRQVVYVQRETDLKANKGRTSLWLLDLAPAKGEPRRLTQPEGGDSSPHWSPDGRTLYSLSTRSGSSQVWRLTLPGGEPQKVTDYPLDVGAFTALQRRGIESELLVFPDENHWVLKPPTASSGITRCCRG
jgi:dipeptidyl aminopeptidase/acylaminoacyl peptidase